MDTAPSRSSRLLNYNYRASCRIPPYNFVVRGALKVPKTMQAITTILGFPVDLDNKTFLLRISCLYCRAWKNQAKH